MHFTKSFITLFTTGLALAAALPSERRNGPPADQVQIVKVVAGGTGCPEGTVHNSTSTDKTLITLIYDNYVASSGPGVSAKEHQKSCQLNLKIHFPQGWQ